MEKELLEMIKHTLEFYADKDNYKKLECPATGLTIMQDDNGTRARSILKLIYNSNSVV